MSEKVIDIALVQFFRERHNPESNRARALNTLGGITGAEIVCMPEVWMGATVPGEAELDALLSDLGGAAKKGGFTLLTGGLFFRRGDLIFGACLVISPDGTVTGEQKKIFPSGAVGERSYCTGGDRIHFFEAGGVKFSVAVCVDLFYPEIIRHMALEGVDLIFNPANIPEPRNELWHSLVRARAAENTVFVAYANNTGTEYADGRGVAGRSLVCGPDGETIAAADKDETILRARIDLSIIEDRRTRWAYLEDVREMNPIREGSASGHRLAPTMINGRTAPE